MIANKTTSVSAERTVSEIQKMLALAKASAVMLEFEEGQPSGIAFNITCNGTEISFRLPCNWKGVLEAMKREKTPQRLLTKDQAKRVSWRITRDWLRAQLSLVESGKSTIQEVMLPWAITNDGSTVGTRLLSGSTPLLSFKGNAS